MKNVYLAILIIYTSNIFAIEYNQYEMKTEHVFSAENGEQDIDKVGLGFAFEGGLSAGGPTIFFDDNNLILADQEKSRTIFLNDDYTFNEFFAKSFYLSNIYFIPSFYFMGITTEGHIGIFNKKNGWELIVLLSVDNLAFLRNSKSAFYHSNILFIHDENGKLWSIKNPGLDDSKNRKNLLDEKKTLALFKNGDIDGLTIDSEKRLFLNGELQTLDYAIFYSYYKSLHPELEKLTKLQFQISSKTANMMTYLNKDSDLNTYWDMGGKYIAIFNDSGLLFDFFEYDGDKSSTTPAVSPSGDIYFMHHGEEKVTLYKIDRQW